MKRIFESYPFSLIALLLCCVIGLFFPYDILQPCLPQERNNQHMTVSGKINFEDETIPEVQFPDNMACHFLDRSFLCINIYNNTPCQ